MRSLPVRRPGVDCPAGLLIHDLDRRARHFLVTRDVRLVDLHGQRLVLHQNGLPIDLLPVLIRQRTVFLDLERHVSRVRVALRRSRLLQRVDLARLQLVADVVRSLPVGGPGVNRLAGFLVHDLDRRARHFLVTRGVRLVDLDVQFLILNRQFSGLLVIGEVAFRSGDGFPSLPTLRLIVFT